jgi:multiple sugar transport system permease protein
MYFMSVIRNKLALAAGILSSTETRFKGWIGVILISPWLIGLVIFKLLPILASLFFSFTNFHLLNPNQVQFVGLKNYLSIFKDGNVGDVFLKTVKLALIIIPLQTLASIAIAALLSSQRLWKRDILRTLFFIPSIIPAFAATLMWQGFMSPSTGWLNRIFLNPFGLASWNIFSSRGASQPLMIFSSLWTIGPGMLIMMGAMQGIPPEVYEAALMDGAGRWARFFKITTPLITPAIFFSLVLNLTAVFGGAILLDRGNTFSVELSSFDAYVNFQLFNMFNLGYASSLAWIFFIFVTIVVLVLFRTSQSWVYFPDREN